ncbi:hypothetical protein NQ317_013084 [Molorchus minor]|uniref:Uncharacterized protein n=1 Tax=Molorchus minor TaxID=1323400 RepID=A0ABQ9JCC7_9CUCU|nr:hypothetical protein NQ317_013084 [Molorchus minor]
MESLGDVDVSCNRLPHESSSDMMTTKNQYGLPESYNPADHPPVKLRNHQSSCDQSETQRKRRSKNRLSNRRSTGYVPSGLIDEALKMGPDSNEQDNGHKS